MRDGICEVDGCGRPTVAKGLCGMHYQRQHPNPHHAQPAEGFNSTNGRALADQTREVKMPQFSWDTKN